EAAVPRFFRSIECRCPNLTPARYSSPYTPLESTFGKPLTGGTREATHTFPWSSAPTDQGPSLPLDPACAASKWVTRFTRGAAPSTPNMRSEEHTSELQSPC